MRTAAFHESRHLSDGQLSPSAPTCPICGGTDRRSVFGLQSEPPVELLRCATCHAASASRLPTPAALDEYYSTYLDHGPEDHVTMDGVDRFGRHVAQLISPNRPARILDFGGGDGALAVAIATATGTGSDISVVDYAAHPRDTPPGVNLTHVAEIDDLGEGSWDLVLASAVLEHLPDLRPRLENLLARVAPGGHFYARTPYVVPLMQAAARVRIQIDFTFPGHIHDLGQEFWDGLGEWCEPLERFDCVHSAPSLVETTIRHHPTRTVAAHMLKAPWRMLRNRWPFVGGWEVLYHRSADDAP